MSESRERLSPAGERRRDAILHTVLVDVRNRRRRRQMLKGGGGVLAALLVAAVWLNVRPPGPASAPTSVAPAVPQATAIPVPGGAGVAPVPGPVAVAPMPTVVVQVLPADPTVAERLAVRSDPTVAARLAVTPEPATWRPIDDAALIAELAEAGQQAGLARVNGRTLIVTR